VENGRLDIDFTDRIHYPSIAGLVVTGRDFSKKINCGGGETGDYEADWPETPRLAPILDFYEDWAGAEFGPEVAAEAAAVLARVDGHLPQPNVWTGPGGIKPDPRPWDEVRKEYDFVDSLAALEPRVIGPGNKARFAYWLAAFSYLREMARQECLWAEWNAAWESVRSLGDETSRKAAASKKLLPIRMKMVAGLRDLYGFLLATVSSPGELGTVANWEQHLLPALMLRPGSELRQILGQEIPASADLPNGYDGPPRVIVPTVRTVLAVGEALRLKVIVLAKEPPSGATLYWREMGQGEYVGVPLQHVARGVYTASCPDTAKDLEYYVEVKIKNETLDFPPTAPLTGQTVVRTR
jgi:hypothetical protein